MMRNYHELSDDEVQQLEQLYPVTPNRRLSQMFGVSVDAIVEHFARPRGWQKDQEAIKLAIRGSYHRLTEREEQWIVRHYHNTRNGDIITKYGIGESQLRRVRVKYGLKKTDRFMRKMRREAVEHGVIAFREHGESERASERTRKAWEERKRTGDYGNVGFKKGESNKDRMSPRRYRQMVEKATKKRNETIRKDRIRIHFGLEPKTKLVKNWDGKRNRHKSHYRYKFRQFGYDVEIGSNDVYYFPDTVRHPIMERNAQKRGIRILPAEEEYE
jgi:hypothetical protein